MSQITRCPACQTLFKVVPDQLRISGGWVRCGQCGEIFDASTQRVSPLTKECLPDIYSGSASAPPETSKNEASVEPAQGQPLQVVPATPVELPMPEADSSTELNSVTFLHTSGNDPYWHSPVIRVLLVLLSAGLMLGLAGQIVLHERDRIVAQHPGLRPWLLAFCVPLNCRLSALKEKNSIVIDSASLNKITGDSYRLNFTLRNTSTMTLAVPAIELTLTDSQDQPVLRRVFLAAELGLKSDTLAAGSEHVTSLAVAVKLASAAQQIVGYRLYAFYP